MTNIFKTLYNNFKEKPLIIIDEVIALITAMVLNCFHPERSPSCVVFIALNITMSAV